MTGMMFDRDLQQALVAQMTKESDARIASLQAPRDASRDAMDAEWLALMKASVVASDRTARALEDLRKDLLAGLLKG